LIALIEEEGLVSYAYYFILIEILREQENYRFPMKLVSAIAKEWQTHGKDMALKIIDKMIKIRLLDHFTVDDEDYIDSPSLNKRMSYFDDIKKKRSDAGKAGAMALWQTHGKRMAKDGKESKSNKVKVINKSKVFIPPTVEEVASYCKERNNSINADKFVNHYQASGWLRGKTPIKDWKACIRTWEANNKNNPDERILTPAQKYGVQSMKRLEERLAREGRLKNEHEDV